MKEAQFNAIYRRYEPSDVLYQDFWLDRGGELEAYSAYLDASEPQEDFDAEDYTWN